LPEVDFQGNRNRFDAEEVRAVRGNFDFGGWTAIIVSRWILEFEAEPLQQLAEILVGIGSIPTSVNRVFRWMETTGMKWSRDFF
jgi:hypothetical protein